MATATKATFTEQQKSEALASARASLKARRNARESNPRLRRNSFEAWGNDKCISRLIDTIDAMKGGYATAAQYRYWLTH